MFPCQLFGAENYTSLGVPEVSAPANETKEETVPPLPHSIISVFVLLYKGGFQYGCWLL